MGGSPNSKIKKIGVEGGIQLGTGLATVHNEVMLSKFDASIFDVSVLDNEKFYELLFLNTFANLLILEAYLTCANSKIENLLTVDFYVPSFLLITESFNLAFAIYSAFFFFLGGYRGDVVDINYFPLVSVQIDFAPYNPPGLMYFPIAATAAVEA